MRSLYKVTDTAPPYVNGAPVAPGHLLTLTEAEALYERDLGHVEATTAEAEAGPLDLTDAERAALPALAPETAGEAGALLSDIRWSAAPTVLLPAPALDAEPSPAAE